MCKNVERRNTLIIGDLQDIHRNTRERTKPLVERRGWDSNPRYRCRYTSFPGWPIQPLLHPSGFQRNVECYPATARVDTKAAVRATGISHKPIRVVTGDFPLDRRTRER